MNLTNKNKFIFVSLSNNEKEKNEREKNLILMFKMLKKKRDDLITSLNLL